MYSCNTQLETQNFALKTIKIKLTNQNYINSYTNCDQSCD